MEPKKNPEVNLERKRGLFLQIGLVIALLVVLGAFEYKTYEKIAYNLGALSLDDLEEEIIPITKQEVKPPPPQNTKPFQIKSKTKPTPPKGPQPKIINGKQK